MTEPIAIIPAALTPDQAEAARLAKLPTPELLAGLTASISNGTPFFGHQEILNRLVSGRMTDAKHRAAEAAGYTQLWADMLDSYKDNKYFGQQGMDFLSWLMTTEVEVAEDLKRWLKMDAAATALGKRDDPTFLNAEGFAYSRVLLAHAFRRPFLSKGNGLRFDMTIGGRINLKTLRTSFNAATKRYGWGTRGPHDV